MKWSDDERIKMAEPYIERNGDNFGEAIKDVLKEVNIDSIAVNKNLLNWLLRDVEDILIPDNVLDRLIDPILINSMEKFEDHIKSLFDKWDIYLTLEYDNDISPSETCAEIRGPSQQIKFVASLMSQFFAKNSEIPLGILSFVDFDELIKIEFRRCNKSDAYKNLKTFFGGMEDTLKTIKNRSEFWKFFVNMYVLNNYNMVCIHKNYFEDFLADKTPSGDILLETMEKKPVQDIPLKELLDIVKTNCEVSRIIERAEIEGDNMIIFHNYRDKQAKEKIRKFFSKLLETRGHSYDVKMASNMIILNHSEQRNINS
jgi:hypothetical protein